MNPSQIERLQKTLRIFIFAIPAAAIAVGAYLVLFPVEIFSYSSKQPEIAKLSIEKNEAENEISLGAFPTLNHQFVDLTVSFGNSRDACSESPAEISLEKTYQAFLYPDGDPIRSEEELKDYLFRGNESRFPNGSLLHLKPTDEVYLLSDGKKILFPGPEIFRAFGYSFDNLTEAEKSTLDQFPDADKRIFLWTQPHPDGTLFQAYPSHKIFLIADGKKHGIENVGNLTELWPKYFTIPVNDTDLRNRIVCPPQALQQGNQKIFCRFNRQQMPSSLGGYYNFALEYPSNCPVASFNLDKAKIVLVSEKSFATVKDSFRKIFSLTLNRYFLKE